jgi:hypothetical protein
VSKNQILKIALIVLAVMGAAQILRSKNVPVASQVAKAVTG